MMDLNEAIMHARQVACGCEATNRDCAYQHDKLADWLELLKQYIDTGVLPNEICALIGIRDFMIDNDITLDWLYQVVTAKKDGEAPQH